MTFNDIWATYEGHLLNFINTKIEDKLNAKDILQDVSIKLFDNLNRGTEITNYKAWLFQVTRHTIADHYRKNTKYLDLQVNATETTHINSTACVCDLSGFIIQTYLPEKYSKPLYLSDIEKKPQQEIAKMLNLTLTATKSRIQRGRIKLKELIDQCVNISYNTKGEIFDFQLKKDCELPQELKTEMKRLNLVL